MTWQQHSIESLPHDARDAALLAKANALHDLACKFQDQLNEVGVYLGDEPLLQAKRRIDDACTAARRVADRLRHNPKARAVAIAKKVGPR